MSSFIAPEPEVVADEPLILGEGPLWHEDDARLYWVDIEGRKLFRYDPEGGRHELVHHGELIAGFTIQEDGSLLLFMGRGTVKQLAGGKLLPVIEDIPAEHDTRFNDVIADPEGRVFCGTMPTETRSGRLYRLDTDGRLTEVLSGIGVSNGMGFSPDLATMYHTDTTAGTITAYAYDRATGEMRDGRVVIRVPKGEGGPDGMTVDAEGDIWSARWGGSALHKYAPDGTELGKVPFPGARNVTSIAFGGPGYAHAYVTTAGGDDRPANGDLAGALFRLSPGVRGRPPFRSKVGL